MVLLLYFVVPWQTKSNELMLYEQPMYSFNYKYIYNNQHNPADVL